MDAVAEHNQMCMSGQEVTLQMVCIEGEQFVKENITSLEKSELISIIGGYVTSGVMKQLPYL
jgi:hypothetical protein